MAKPDDYAANTSTTGKLVVPDTGSVFVTGNIEIKIDHDWFAVFLEAGKTYRFSDFDPATYNYREQDFPDFFSSDLNSPLKPQMSVYTAAGERETLDNLHFSDYYTPIDSGVYYLDISAENFDSTGAYKLLVDQVTDDYPDHISNIKPILVGDTEVKIPRQEDIPGDHDWIPLQLVAGKSYAIHNLFYKANVPSLTFVSITISAETFMSLKDSQGQLLPNLVSHGADFAFSVPTSGVYYLDVSGENAFSLGDNSKFNIKSYQDDYVDNIATQGQLVLANKQTTSSNGRIEVDGDHDWFNVSLTAGKNYVFSVNSVQNGLQYPRIQLHDATGNVVFTGNDNTHISFTARSSGHYYVDVASWVDKVTVIEGDVSTGGVYTGAYTLTATQTNDDYGNNRLTAGKLDLTNTNGISTALTGHIEIG